MLSILEHDSIDIAFLCETFLNDSIPDSLFNHSIYSYFRCDRPRDNPKSRGGGVLIFWKKCHRLAQVDIKIEQHYSLHNCELLAFDIYSTKSCRKRIFLIYRAPDSTFVQTSALLKHVQSYLLPNDSDNILLGDFNCPKINWSAFVSPKDNSQRPIFNFALLHKFKQLVNFPTRISKSGTANILDLIFCQQNDLITDCSQKLPLLNSDHHTVSFNLNMPSVTIPPQLPIRYNHRKSNYNFVNQFMSSLNWDRQFSYFSTFQSKYNHFVKVFLEAIEHDCPIINPNVRSKPNHKLLRLLKKRKELRNDNREYRLIQKKIKAVKRQQRENEESKLLEVYRGKSFFNYVNCRLKSKVDIPTLLDEQLNSIAFTPLEKADMLQSKFMDNYADLHSKVDTPPIFPCKRKAPLEIDFSPQNVYQYLCRLPNKVSTNKEGITQIALKNSAVSIALPLSLLFTESYNSGLIPLQWKESFVVPIFKSGKRSDPSNYRPISLTSTICRLMEKILTDAIRNRFACNFDVNQFGFISRRSCCLSLLKSTSHWQTELKMKNSVDVVYFDFLKAFDRVSHQKLSSKLLQIGFDGKTSKWFDEFLKDRTCQAMVSGCMSTRCDNVPSGVPQGTVSGPILFLLYIYDLFCCIQPGISYTLFADDLKIYGTDPQAIQITIRHISDWSKMWELPIAVHKTQILHLGKNNPNVPYYLDGQKIDAPLKCKDLGVIIDRQLSFEPHINIVVSKASVACRCILKAFCFSDPQKFFDLYDIYVRPILSYCSPIYCPKPNSSLSNTLETPLRYYSRQVFKRFGIRPCSYKERLIQFNIKSQFESRFSADCTLAYNMLFLNSHFPSCPLELCQSLRHPIRMKCLRNVYESDNFYFARLPREWNLIAPKFSEFPSLMQFKNIVNNYDILSENDIPFVLRY